MSESQKQIDNKVNTIRLASIIALSGNAVLALLKIVTGVISSSSALVADGFDSSADVLISVIALVVVRIISKPADAEHPWGHGRAETVATALLSFILFFIGGQLIASALPSLISGELKAVPSPIAVVVTLISITGKIALAISQQALGKRADSAMVKANAKNMASDVLVSISVLVGLIISTLTGKATADAIITMLIGAWIIKTAIGIFLESNRELMDGNNDMESYKIIVDVVNASNGAANPHRVRMRRIAEFWDIDLDIDVDPSCTVKEAHIIATEIEQEIKRQLGSVYDIVIHVEPRGDNSAEAFGLTEKHIEKHINESELAK